MSTKNMAGDSGDEKPEKSLFRIILVDGFLIRGGLFALWMFVGGFCADWLLGRNVSFVDYTSSRTTWTNFLFYFLAFGLFIAVDEWFRHEGSEVEQYNITESDDMVSNAQR